MASADDIKNLMLAYEIVGNDLDQRGCKKVANITDKVMYRISQNSTWQNVGDALQSTVIDPAVAAGQTAMNAANAVGQTASNAANAVGQFAQDWLSPQALAAKSAQFLQEQLNKAVDATVKQKLTAELQRRGIQPNTSNTTANPSPSQGAATQTGGPRVTFAPEPAQGYTSFDSDLEKRYLGWGYDMLQRGVPFEKALDEVTKHVTSRQNPEFARITIKAFKDQYGNQVPSNTAV